MKNWYSQDSLQNLEDNEIHIWLNYLNTHQAKLKHLYPLLSDAEKERSERFKHFKHRKQFIASHGFLHSVLSYYIETEAQEIKFEQGEFGKPSINKEQNPHHINFNLSHSNNLAILAVCKQHAIGIDIEFKERKSDWNALAKRFFTEEEKTQLFKLEESLQKDAFYKVWTRKEAHMKVTGQGLHLPPTQFEVSVPPASAAFIKQLNTPDKNLYKMADIIIPDMYTDYVACLSASFEFSDIKQFAHN